MTNRIRKELSAIAREVKIVFRLVVVERSTKPRTAAKAFVMGFSDGWDQPYSLSSSWNVEHLPGEYWTNQELLDIGINWGQRLRSPLNHQEI